MEQRASGEDLLNKFRRLKNKYLPWGTRRRVVYEWCLKQAKNLIGTSPHALGEILLLRYRRVKNKLFPWDTQRGRIYQSFVTFIKRISSISLKGSKIKRRLPHFRSVIIPNKYDVICFPIIDWHFRYQRPQQILNQFAKAGHRIFYINRDFAWSSQEEYFEITPIEKNISLLTLNSKNSLNISQDQISSPDLNILKKSLDSFIVNAKIKDALCLVDLPFWTPLALYLKSSQGFAIVYDCMDEHSGFTTNSPQMLSQEEPLRKEADLILASSQRLYNASKLTNKNVVLVPNATDVDHFASAKRNSQLRSLKPPIVGYYGDISNHIDIDLVKSAAEGYPDYSFVVIGRAFEVNLSDLQSLPNVYLLDEIHYKTLPGYLAWFDVCMIPFKICPRTLAANSVKFYEYLSAGKPVVSVRLPELEQYQHLCYLASGKDEFVQFLSRALNENTPDKIAERVHFAKGNTWHDRFKVITKSIKDSYQKASIIIVTYNNMHLTQQCIESIKKYTAYPNYEIIVVDNASNDGTVDYLKALENKGEICFILNTENKGFAAANNQGIKVSSGEYLILLNNDTAVTRGWLTRIVHYLKEPSIGLVGPVSNWVGNESKIKTSYSSLEQMHQFAEDYTLDNRGKTFEIRMLVMFCLGMRRQLISEIGFLDENFGIGSFEDDDFSYRVKQKGYRLICAEDIFIHHEGMASLKKLDNAHYKQIFEQNKRYFENKWSIKWIPHNSREITLKTLTDRNEL